MTKRKELIHELQNSIREYKLKGGTLRVLKIQHDTDRLLRYSWKMRGDKR